MDQGICQIWQMLDYPTLLLCEDLTLLSWRKAEDLNPTPLGAICFQNSAGALSGSPSVAEAEGLEPPRVISSTRIRNERLTIRLRLRYGPYITLLVDAVRNVLIIATCSMPIHASGPKIQTTTNFMNVIVTFLVRAKGLEPPTGGLKIRCSTN